jgi:hypothetical protein
LPSKEPGIYVVGAVFDQGLSFDDVAPYLGFCPKQDKHEVAERLYIGKLQMPCSTRVLALMILFKPWASLMWEEALL